MSGRSRASLPHATQSGRVLEVDFFARPALVVARELLGKYLVRRVGREETAAMINETEAYVGAHDLACHASMGRTQRNEVLFGPPGCWYVYFIYGIHWMLNAVTNEEGHPAAVLLRGAGQWNGPGKLTKAMRIDKSQNALPIGKATGLWIEDRGYRVRRGEILRTPRIGVDYARHWAAKPYRFVLRERPGGKLNLKSRGIASMRLNKKESH
jgi:DNA-3-methyladenine glycosylase